MAVALAYGELTPRQLAADVPPLPNVRAWIERIPCRADVTAAPRDVGGRTIRAFGHFGMREVQQVNAKGHPDHPLSDGELLAKLNANVSYAGLSESAAARLAEQIMTIDGMKDMNSFADALETVIP